MHDSAGPHTWSPHTSPQELQSAWQVAHDSVKPHLPSPQTSGQLPQSSGQSTQVSNTLQSLSPHQAHVPQSGRHVEHDSG